VVAMKIIFFGYGSEAKGVTEEKGERNSSSLSMPLHHPKRK